MQCEEIYLIEKIKSKFAEQYKEIQRKFEESEKNFRIRYNEELYLILKECIPTYGHDMIEKYKDRLQIVSFGETRLALRKELEELKEKARELM